MACVCLPPHNITLSVSSWPPPHHSTFLSITLQTPSAPPPAAIVMAAVQELSGEKSRGRLMLNRRYGLLKGIYMKLEARYSSLPGLFHGFETWHTSTLIQALQLYNMPRTDLLGTKPAWFPGSISFSFLFQLQLISFSSDNAWRPLKRFYSLGDCFLLTAFSRMFPWWEQIFIARFNCKLETSSGASVPGSAGVWINKTQFKWDTFFSLGIVLADQQVELLYYYRANSLPPQTIFGSVVQS